MSSPSPAFPTAAIPAPASHEFGLGLHLAALLAALALAWAVDMLA